MGAVNGIGIPTIEIPDECSLIDPLKNLEFSIFTPSGTIMVSASPWRFYCSGDVRALTEGGLISPEWLPGIPGNCKTRQCVAFSDGVPRPLVGLRKGKRNPSQSIIIERRSKRIYRVEVPTTSAQQAFIQTLREQRREEAEKKAAVEREAKRRRESRAKPQAQIRSECANIATNAMRLIDALLEEAGYQYNKEAQASISRAFTELRSAFAGGGLNRDKAALQRDGNVVFLPPIEPK